MSEQFSPLASFVERTLLGSECRLWSIHVALSSFWPCCLRSENRKENPPAKAGGQSSEKRLTLAALLAGLLLPALLSALTRLLLLVSTGLLLLVLVPGFGVSILGARRWFAAGPIQFQPSEVMKLALILYVCGYLADHPKREAIKVEARRVLKEALA